MTVEEQRRPARRVEGGESDFRQLEEPAAAVADHGEQQLALRLPGPVPAGRPQNDRRLVGRRRRFDDVVAGVGEGVGGAADRRGDAWIGRPARRLGGTATRSGRSGAGGSATGRDSGSRTWAPATVQESGADVGDAAGHHALDHHQLADMSSSTGGTVVAWGTTPVVGLIEAMPQQWAGLRSDPPRSLPSPSGDIPLASADASPPLDPPAVTFGFHGLRVRPCSDESVCTRSPRSGRLVRANGIAPAARMRSTTGASTLGDGVGEGDDAWVVGVPATSMFSLTVIGTPWSGADVVAVGERLVGGVGGGQGLVVEEADDGVERR